MQGAGNQASIHCTRALWHQPHDKQRDHDFVWCITPLHIKVIHT